jgi:hypothetical protein
MNTMQDTGADDIESRFAIGQTILNQLGRVTLAMLGCSQPLATESGVQFAIQGSPKRIRKLVVNLDQGTDTYTVEGWSKRGRFDWFCAETVTDVHVGELHRVIEGMTGLYTRL